MCGRFTLTIPTYEELADILGVPVDPAIAAAYRPRYNVAPTDPHFILRVKDGARTIVPARWGLVPHYSKDASGAARNINARAESARTRPGFRDAFEHRRCIVPADGFFEWAGDKKARKATWFHAPDGELTYFAGLYEGWQDPRTGDFVRTFTILTTRPNALVEPLHDRMPVLLARADIDRWMTAPSNDVGDLLKPAPVESLAALRVVDRVNSVRNDDPACLEPRGDDGLFPE